MAAWGSGMSAGCTALINSFQSRTNRSLNAHFVWHIFQSVQQQWAETTSAGKWNTNKLKM